MVFIFQHHLVFAAFIAQVFLGLLFFFNSYELSSRIKMDNFVVAYKYSFVNNSTPKLVTVLWSRIISYVELIVGFLLTICQYKYCSHVFFKVDLILVSIAFGITILKWDIRFVSPLLAAVLFLLSVPTVWNYWSFDGLIFNSNNLF